MPVTFPCRICKKPVASNHRAIECDVCHVWVHIKCNNVSQEAYNKYVDSGNKNLNWICLPCINDAVPFVEVPDEILKLTLQGKNIDCSLFEEGLTNTSNNTVFRNIEKVSFCR